MTGPRPADPEVGLALDRTHSSALLQARHIPARVGFWEILGSDGLVQSRDDCPECQAFDQLFETEAMDGFVMTMREDLGLLFRYVHHLPPMLVTPGRYFLFVVRGLGAREEPSGKVVQGFDDAQLRHLARLLVLAGLEAEDDAEPRVPADPFEGRPDARERDEQRRGHIQENPFECGEPIQGGAFRCTERFRTARGLAQHRRRGWQHRPGVEYAATPIERGP